MGQADLKAFYLLFAPPEGPRRCPPLILAGDRYSSRGQRSRKTRRQQGPTLKGSNPGGVTPVLRPPAQGNATPRLRDRGTRLALCGGVAPTYYLVPLQGTKNLPSGLILRHPVSDFTDSVLRLCSLRRESPHAGHSRESGNPPSCGTTWTPGLPCHSERSEESRPGLWRKESERDSSLRSE
jgi:hypothetical protein